MPGDIPHVQPGDRPKAARQNLIADALMQRDTPANSIVDNLGVSTRPPAIPSGPFVLRWGKLDGALAAGGTQTVSLWQKTDGGWDGWDEDSTENWETCYAPPVLASGTIDSGSWVLVGVVNGRRVVLLAEC